MAVLPLVDARELSQRMRFVRAFTEQQPVLEDADHHAFSATSVDLGLIDARMQLAELSLALDQTPEAARLLSTVGDSEARDLSPLRAMTAAVMLDLALPSDLWRGAADAARSEPQVELFCALEMAWRAETQFDIGSERQGVLAHAARRARIQQLKPLLSPREADRARSYVARSVFIALHADYAARLTASMEERRFSFTPAPWSLIDWPLLAAHLAMVRTGRRVRIPKAAIDRHPAFALMFFLRAVAKELDGERRLSQ